MSGISSCRYDSMLVQYEYRNWAMSYRLMSNASEYPAFQASFSVAAHHNKVYTFHLCYRKDRGRYRASNHFSLRCYMLQFFGVDVQEIVYVVVGILPFFYERFRL